MNESVKDKSNDLMPFFIAGFASIFVVLISNVVSLGVGAMLEVLTSSCVLAEWSQLLLLVGLSGGLILLVRSIGKSWYNTNSYKYKAYMLGIYACTSIAVMYFMLYTVVI